MVTDGGWALRAKSCDTCKSAAAAVFCRVHLAFLCLRCDSGIHGMGTQFPVRHERVLMCEVCEQAPASVTCRADAAALCASCDTDIHSANSLASRHDRFPVEPFYDEAESIARSMSLGFFLPPAKTEVCGGMCGQDELDAEPWLLPYLENHGEFNFVEGAYAKVAPAAVVDSRGLFLNEMESLLDLEFGTGGGMDQLPSSAADRLVPAQGNPMMITQNRPQEHCLDTDFSRSKLSSFGHLPPSLTENVSSSSLGTGVVPEGASHSSSANTAQSVGSQPTQLCGIDREARVLRYREKRKNRKFEKTIRYASRKVYAETRPRIKGRFAKRPETAIDPETDMDNYLFSSAFMADASYGIVPTF
ncbi:hypothetical protein MLD38_006726 [Melastoma candidum]|uniref:Uncharacterized protein n=1 Tax=Melastoma candidum TaxID=119954 RepID=A0ACB9RNU4_9MYRT|nr:hypothetical protein MLD38_006726 [Melastoma candidum]